MADGASAPQVDDAATPTADHSAAFGGKNISWWGSYVLNLNNAMGPICVILPLMNHQAGWFTPMLALFIVFVLSSFACTMLCEAAQRIPGNRNFEKRIEFCDLVRYYYGHRAYVASQIAFNVSLQASNIAAMIVSAQVLDDFIIHIFKTSYALDYVRFVGIRAEAGHSCTATGQIWFDPETGDPIQTVISLGYVLSMALCIPFGIMKLDENMWFQWLSCIGLMVFTGEFMVQFAMNMTPHGDGWTEGTGTDLLPVMTSNQSQVLGISMFAFAWVVTVPSWLNEKKEGVSVNSAVWAPATTGFLMKVAVGLFGGWAFISPTSNILVNLASGCAPQSMPEITRYSSYLWNVLTLVPGIPILAIMVKYNLITGKIASPFMANLLGVVLPWVITAFCYELNVLNTLCNWIAILVQGYVNFLVPIMLYRRALIEFPREGDGVEWMRHRAVPHEDARTPVRAVSMKVTKHEHIPIGDAHAVVGSGTSEEGVWSHTEDGVHVVGGTGTGSEEGDMDTMSPSKMLSPLARAPSLSRKGGRALGDAAMSPGGRGGGDDSGDEGGPGMSRGGDVTPLLVTSPRGGDVTPHHDGSLNVQHRHRGASSDGEADEREAAEGGIRMKLTNSFLDATGSPDSDSVAETVVLEDDVNAVPAWMRQWITPLRFSTWTAGFFSVLCTAFVIFNIVESIVNGSASA